MTRPILVVSGGAESVSVSVVEWAIEAGKEVHVYALVPNSLLEGVPGVSSVRYAGGQSRQAIVADLGACILELRSTESGPMLCVPTEDDSLGLVLETHSLLGDQAVVCSRCRAVPGGGLDKASLFSFLESAGLGHLIAESVTVSSEVELRATVAALGPGVITKPSIKPWRATLENGAKTHAGPELLSDSRVQERSRDFIAGRKWLVQRRLRPIRGGERSACVVRDQGGTVRYVEVVEWAKYPERGGSACLVETQPGERRLHEATLAILAAVDAVGIVELSFLADDSGMPRLLELNVRPWLQIDLLQSAGFDLLADADRALSGQAIPTTEVAVTRRSWMSLERFLLKLFSGDGGSRWRTLSCMFRALRQRPIFSTWSTGLRGVRVRWARRIFSRAFR